MREDGLTKEEGIVMDCLVEAWNNFVKLERQHPNELEDFANAIHNAQSILGLRILRREHPNGWIVKK